jgi:hypothetical protein
MLRRRCLVEIKVLKSVFINLPAKDIFEYLSNLDNMVDWASTTISMRQTSPGEIGTGAVVSSTFRFLGKWLNMVFEIVEYSSERCLTLKSIAGSPSSLFRYHLEALEEGGTVVSEEAVIQMAGSVGESTNSVVASAITRQIEYDLQTLKEVLEAGMVPS